MTPEEQAILADSMGQALLIVLDRLTPAERISFVLHDMFSVSFEEIAGVLGKSPEACRQLASRARRRVRTAEDPTSDPQRQRQRSSMRSSAAAKSGDFQMLLSLLSPDVELVADPAAIAMGAPTSLIGPDDVASRFSGRAKACPDGSCSTGSPGWCGRRAALRGSSLISRVAAGQVTRIEMIADEEVLGEIEIERLAAETTP